MHFRVLGPLVVEGPTGTVDVAASRLRVVLAMLLLEAGRVVSVDRLIEAVWDEAPPATAMGQIHICISGLRRLLSNVGLAGVIVTRSPGYLVVLDPEDLDQSVFQRLVAEGRAAREARQYEDAVAALTTALALWRSKPLADVDSSLVRSATAWLEELHTRVVEERIDLLLQLGAHSELVAELTELVAVYPLREHLRAQLMLALSRSGRQAEALARYREARTILVTELGIEPGIELRELERAILVGEVESEAAPSAPVAPAPVVRALPADIADFTGNTKTKNRLRAMISDMANRDDGAPVGVVAIFGQGGVGKSALALHVAHALGPSFPDGQLFASLLGSTATPLPPTRILERFLRALGCASTAVPDSLEDRAAAFRSAVAGRRLMLLLDDAADERQVRPLLPGGAPCVVVVTSRQQLTGIPGAEHVQCSTLDTSDAVELVARIVGPRVHAEPRPTLQLVNVCGRLPLALRIASARLLSRPHWTVGRFVDRLRDERLRLDELSHGGDDVRSTIALSYRGLDGEAKRLLCFMGMLNAPDTGEWLCAPLLGVDSSTAEEVLGVLVSRQLVQVDAAPDQAPRFRLHELVRAYVRERLPEEQFSEDAAAALIRALGAWLFLADEVHRREYGGDFTLLHSSARRWPLTADACDRLLHNPLQWYEQERFALVTTIRDAANAGAVADEYCWDLAMSSVVMFETRSFFDDWRTTHEVALAAVRLSGNRLGEAAMLYSLGALAIAEYRLDDAVAQLEAARTRFAALGAAHGQALADRNLAFVDRVRANLPEAERRYRRARATLRRVGDLSGEAHTLAGLAHVALAGNDHSQARALIMEALELTEASGNRRIKAQLMQLLGEIELVKEDAEGAQRAFRDALERVRELGDRIGEAYALHGLAVAELRDGRHDDAARTLRLAEQRAIEGADKMIQARIRLASAEAMRARGSVEAASRYAGAAVEMFRRLEAPLWQVRAMCLLGELCMTQGSPGAAVAIWREALTAAQVVNAAERMELIAKLEAELAPLTNS